jgi:hypothetical protein
MSEPTLDTDAIVDVFHHLQRNEKPWLEIICEQGLDGVKVKRALEVVFPQGDQRINVAVQAFALGAQLGAMRLDPVPFDAKEADTCQCLLCTFRRAAESAEEAEGEEDE